MNIVITGANRGIGIELARQYLKRGDTVWAAVRMPEAAEELNLLQASAPGRLHIHGCDVAGDKSVRAFAAAVKGPVHVLFNNAGVRSKSDDNLEKIDFQAATRAMQINALGVLRVTGALLPQLREAKGAKVISLSSGLGSITDNTSGGGYAYRMSKAALNMAARTIAQDFRGEGILSIAVSPGWVQTDMGGRSAPTPVDESAAGLIALVERLKPEDSGEFFDYRGERLPW